MNNLKKILFCFLLLNFIQGIYGYLYPNDSWPMSFNYCYGFARNPIKNMFNDENVTKWFNQGYNPDDRYSPIKGQWHDPILGYLKKNSQKVALNAVNQVKNCSAFNKLFGNKAGKFLSRMENNFTFTGSLPNFAWGTVNQFGILVKKGKRNYISFNFYPDVLIYEKHFGDIQNLLKKYDEDYISDYVHDYFSNNHKILFIGSGELMGDEKSAIIKQALESFVANGGVLFIQSQQYGNQVADLVPIPGNESLKFFYVPFSCS